MKVKKIFNLIWNEFVYGGHLLSLGFSGVILSIIILLDIKIDWVILIIAYLLSQIGYNYNHFKEIESDLKSNPERSQYLQKAKKYTLFIFFLYIITLIFLLFYFYNFQFILFILFFLLIEALYTIFFKELTKKFVGFKNFYVSMCWSFGGAFLVIFYYHISFNTSLLFISLFTLLRLIMDTVFFDFKDTEEDKKNNLLTLPIRFGKGETLRFLHILNVFSSLFLIFGIFLKIIPFYFMGLVIFVYFYSFYYLKKAEKGLISEYFRKICYIIVDGQYILWPITIFLGRASF